MSAQKTINHRENDMSKDRATFIVETEYKTARKVYHTFDTRKDARDFAKKQRTKASVFWAQVITAKPGPSNVKV